MGALLAFWYLWILVVKFDIHFLTALLLLKVIPKVNIFSARMCAETKNGPRLFAIKSRATWRSLKLKKMAASWKPIGCGTTADNLNCARNDLLFLLPLHSAKPTHGNLSITSFSNFSTESTSNTFMQIVFSAFKSLNVVLWLTLHGKNSRVVPLNVLLLVTFLYSKCTSISSFPWQTLWNSFQLISVPWPRETKRRDWGTDTL